MFLVTQTELGLRKFETNLSDFLGFTHKSKGFVVTCESINVVCIGGPNQRVGSLGQQSHRMLPTHQFRYRLNLISDK